MTHYAGVLLIAKDGKVILQQRDDNSAIVNPGQIAIFGGTAEPGESPQDCALREIAEEVGLTLAVQQLDYFQTYRTQVAEIGEVESAIFIVTDVDPHSLELNEGKSFFFLDARAPLTGLNLTPVCRLALTDYQKPLKTSPQ